LFLFRYLLPVRATWSAPALPGLALVLIGAVSGITYFLDRRRNLDFGYSSQFFGQREETGSQPQRARPVSRRQPLHFHFV
jgi:hypothetical protein